MKIFIISIPRNSARLCALTNRLRDLELEFEVLLGVDGKDMSDAIFETHNQNAYVALYGKPMNRYEVSCTLGHMGVWRKMLQDKVDKALILEDDVCILSATTKILNHIEKTSPNYDLLYLHHGKAKRWPIYTSLPENYRLYRYRKPSKRSRRAITYATSYILTARAAELLLDDALHNMMPADFIIGLLQRHGLLTRGVEPCCVDHGHFETSTPGRF